ncbi:MAG: phosphatase PAP2 family protein [Candidatus Kapaibacterium sp.]
MNGKLSFREIGRIVAQDWNSADLYTGLMLALYAVLAVVLHQNIHGGATTVWTNVLVLALIASTIVLTRLTESPAIRFVRLFYVVPVIYMLYDQTHLYVTVVHPHDYDSWLIAADRALFGGDPTVWLSRYANPLLTEYLQFCYFIFYLLPVGHALELWFRGDLERVEQFARMMTFMFFISYLLYFCLPAIGPRFTLHDFALTGQELPGVWITDMLRGIINVGGGVVRGVADPASVVNRDCMPSGHTMLTIVNILLAFRFKSRFRHLFLIIGGSLIFGTVYLRYHYVVDLLVGGLLVLLCMPLEVPVDKYLRKTLKM